MYTFVNSLYIPWILDIIIYKKYSRKTTVRYGKTDNKIPKLNTIVNIIRKARIGQKITVDEI